MNTRLIDIKNLLPLIFGWLCIITFVLGGLVFYGENNITLTVLFLVISEISMFCMFGSAIILNDENR